MDISSVSAPSSLDTVSAIGAQHAVFPPATPSGTDTVNISAAGKLLSASTLFDAVSATSPPDFATVAVATQYFVDAFNNFLQSDSLQSTTGGALNSSFMQVLNAGTNAFSLSATGFSMATGQITVNYNALQAAFTANPAGTVSQLAQATLSIGQLAAQFTTLAAQLNSLSQLASSPAGTPAQATTTATAAATTVITAAPTVTALPAATTAVPTAVPTAATAAATTATAATTLPGNVANPVSPTVNSADPAVAAAIASYRMTDGSFDIAKPHDKGPAPKTPGYSEITSIAPIPPVMLNLHA